MQVNKIWFLVTDDDKCIGVDTGSGQPYYTNFWSAKRFTSLEEASSFRDKLHMTAWEIYECEELIARHVPVVDLFESELAALKKKYNRP